jgi:hypothetical protein
MKFAVTVVTPPGYVHSQAFHEVAESLHYGLLELGHRSVLTTQTRLPGHRHIILGSNLLTQFQVRLQPDSILYNLEQIQIGSPWINPALLQLFAKYTTWDYSKRNIEQLAALGISNVVHVPIGYVPQLSRIARAAEEDIDVLFIGSTNDRRMNILRALEARNVRVQAAFGVYGAARDALIARAKIVLNVHFYEAKVFEIVRVSYLLANRKLVVSEVGASPDEEAPFEQGLVFGRYEQLVDLCCGYLTKPEEREQVASAGLEAMKQRPARAFLAEALAQMARTKNSPRKASAAR